MVGVQDSAATRRPSLSPHLCRHGTTFGGHKLRVSVGCELGAGCRSGLSLIVQLCVQGPKGKYPAIAAGDYVKQAFKPQFDAKQVRLPPPVSPHTTLLDGAHMHAMQDVSTVSGHSSPTNRKSCFGM